MCLNVTTTCKTCEKLRSALIGLIGESDKEQLEAMEILVRTSVVSDKDKMVALNAIHALLETI